MSEQVVDIAEQRPVRFCGQVRSDQRGVVDYADAQLMGAMLRNGWRKDFDGKGVPEGTLAHFVGLSLNDDAWKIAIRRLMDWKFLELEAGFKGGALRVVLTELGKSYAQELCGERQREGKPQEGL